MKKLSRLLAAPLIAILLSTALSAQSAPPAAPVQPAALDAAALEKKVDELLNAHVTVNDFGGAVLLARGGKPLVAKGYGYANIEWQIPATPQTKFRIGSVTKQFTSMLIMQLREQGKVKIEDSVCVYVTPCPDAWKPVTVHHLLTHTSGIPTYTAIPSWRETNMVPKTVEQMVAIFRDLPLQWTPGEKYAYNNSGYFLLGVVIEQATGKKYEQALQEMILTPLGLKDTGYDWPGTIIPRRAAGYEGRGPARRNASALDMQQPYSAGSLYSTVEDLLKWEQALYTDSLLPEPARHVMWTPFLNNYAYGWSIAAPSAATFGHKRMAHAGGINGFSSMLIRVPESNVTAIVLSNNASANAGQIARDLLAIYYGQRYTVPAPRTVAQVDPKVFDHYVGTYELRPDFLMTVTREGNGLFTQATGQEKIEVFPLSETKFFPKVLDAEITFVKSADGTVTHLMLMQGGRNQMAKKVR
ncbi:MAG TPA: serine hydrolase [Vicinamibacterales bacterium]|nr:serine hydrolase [Vicinamibacterales bacterium]